MRKNLEKYEAYKKATKKKLTIPSGEHPFFDDDKGGGDVICRVK